MALNALSLRKRLEKKWMQRLDQEKNSRRREYISNNKLAVLCKCPRCEKEHEKNMQWSGRGIPRVYCAICRPLIAAISDAVPARGGMAKGKSAYASENN